MQRGNSWEFFVNDILYVKKHKVWWKCWKFKSGNNKNTLCKHATSFINTLKVYKNQFGESLLWLNASYFIFSFMNLRSATELLARQVNSILLLSKISEKFYLHRLLLLRLFPKSSQNFLIYNRVGKYSEEIQQFY